MAKYSSISKTIGTIDITPLMDLTFMLLIIFIITVPALEYTTEVTPPDMNTATSAEEVPNKVMLTLTKDGTVKINDQMVAMSEVGEHLKRRFAENPEINVLIEADGTRPYEDVIALHRFAMKAGIKNIHLVTSAEAD